MPVLSQDTHTSAPSLTITSPSCYNLRCIQFFLEHSAWSCASRHSPTFPHTLETILGSRPGPGPEFGPGASAPRCLQHSCRLADFSGSVRSSHHRGKARGGRILQEGSPQPSRRFPHLADIQVFLKVIGVIELQDAPECSPFLALTGEK